ncbi:MAG: FAD-dependent monooxygenase, partial [Ginsengibacter sp.]
MQQQISLKLPPTYAADEVAIIENIALAAGKKITEISGYHLLKKSIDARGSSVWINLTLNAFINEPFYQRTLQKFNFKEVGNSSKKVIIIGGGPAGIFAALQLIEYGIKPIILE